MSTTVPTYFCVYQKITFYGSDDQEWMWNVCLLGGMIIFLMNRSDSAGNDIIFETTRVVSAPSGSLEKLINIADKSRN